LFINKPATDGPYWHKQRNKSPAGPSKIDLWPNPTRAKKKLKMHGTILIKWSDIKRVLARPTET